LYVRSSNSRPKSGWNGWVTRTRCRASFASAAVDCPLQGQGRGGGVSGGAMD
jgi:hypothetical protein